MSSKSIFDAHVEHLNSEMLKHGTTEAVAWYEPLLRQVSIKEHFPNYVPGRSYPHYELLNAIPRKSKGVFWHEFTHHMQLLGTAQGLRCLATCCDNMNFIESLSNLMRMHSLEPLMPWQDHLCEVPDQEAVSRIEEYSLRTHRLSANLFSKPEPIEVLSENPVEGMSEYRVLKHLTIRQNVEPFDTDEVDLLASVNLHDRRLVLVPLNAFALREGMATIAEHTLVMNDILGADAGEQAEYRRYIAREANADGLLGYYLLLMWWGINVPRNHYSWPNFLALCEIASMFDSIVNSWPSPNVDVPSPVPRLSACGYFAQLLTALCNHCDTIGPVDELDSSNFVESLLTALNWPDLRQQSERCLAYIQSFREKNRDHLFDEVFPYEQLVDIFEYRHNKLGNRLLLFELMCPDNLDRVNNAMEAVGFPAMRFLNVGFQDPRDSKWPLRYCLVDVARKLRYSDSFRCQFWEEGRPEHCSIYRAKGCEGNPYPGDSSTRYRLCSNGVSLLRFLPEHMRGRQWEDPLPETGGMEM